MPKVSIIIPVYNKGRYVREAVESALSQTYQNIEIVCVDDASTDNSLSVLRKLAERHNNIVLIEENENIGVCAARNRAIETASGEYILPLDADDTIEPTYVAKAVNILNTNSSISVVYSRVRNLISQEEILKPNAANNLLYGNFITCSAIFRKSDFINVGGYDVAFNKIGCEDWDLWLSFLENDLNFFQIDEILFNYRQLYHKSRTAIQWKNSENIYCEILIKHKDLYKKNGLFEQIFQSLRSKGCRSNNKNKYQKYKRLFNILLIIVIVETLIILAYFVCKLLGWIP